MIDNSKTKLRRVHLCLIRGPCFFCFFFGGGGGTRHLLCCGRDASTGSTFPKVLFSSSACFGRIFPNLQRLILGSALCTSQLKRRALFLRPCECRPERSQIYRQPTSTVVLSEIRMQRILSNTRQCILGNARQCILGNTRQYKAMQCNAMLTTQ